MHVNLEEIWISDGREGGDSRRGRPGSDSATTTGNECIVHDTYGMTQGQGQGRRIAFGLREVPENVARRKDDS